MKLIFVWVQGYGYFRDQQGQHICLVKAIFVAHVPYMDGKNVKRLRALEY